MGWNKDGYRELDEKREIEAKVEHPTAKAWLIEETMTGKKVWLPKSIATMGDPDPDGNCIFTVPGWWYKKNLGE